MKNFKFKVNLKNCWVKKTIRGKVALADIAICANASYLAFMLATLYYS